MTVYTCMRLAFPEEFGLFVCEILSDTSTHAAHPGKKLQTRNVQMQYLPDFAYKSLLNRAYSFTCICLLEEYVLARCIASLNITATVEPFFAEV